MLNKLFGGPNIMDESVATNIENRLIINLFKKEMIAKVDTTLGKLYIEKKIFRKKYFSEKLYISYLTILFKNLDYISVSLKYDWINSKYTLDITYDSDIGNETFKSKSIQEVKDIVISNFETTGLLKERWVKNENI